MSKVVRLSDECFDNLMKFIQVKYDRDIKILEENGIPCTGNYFDGLSDSSIINFALLVAIGVYSEE